MYMGILCGIFEWKLKNPLDDDTLMYGTRGVHEEVFKLTQ